MFQLRFLIASPRKMSPHIFCHRDYRGQRTKQDDFHPTFNTYVCQPKGTQTSYDVMLELMQSAAAHQTAQQLFTLVELFNPQTHERLKLAGDEIILRPADLAAAQAAFDATNPASTEPTTAPPVNTVPIETPSLPVSAEGASQSPAQPSVLDRVRTQIQQHGKATATQLATALNLDPADIKAAVATEGSGLQNKGGWISQVS